MIRPVYAVRDFGHNLTSWCSIFYPNTLLHFTAGYLRKRLIATALRYARFRGRAASEATRLADTPASRSKQAPQLSPRAALPALCRLCMPANALSLSRLLMLGCTLGNTLMCVTCWLSGRCWAWRIADVGMEGRGYRVWRSRMSGMEDRGYRAGERRWLNILG